MDCWITLPSCGRIDEKLPPLCTYLVFPLHFFPNQSSHILLIINYLPIMTKMSNSLTTMHGNPIKANTGKSNAKFPPSIADVEQVGTRLGLKALVPSSPSSVVSTALSNLSSPSMSHRWRHCWCWQLNQSQQVQHPHALSISPIQQAFWRKSHTLSASSIPKMWRVNASST